MIQGSYHSPHPHYIGDVNAFLIVIGVSIVILWLPFTNKLKFGEIEIEVESAGYRSSGPVSMTAGLVTETKEKDPLAISLEFFYTNYWE